MSLHCIMNPHGGVLVQCVVAGNPSGANPLEQIRSTENVHAAWQRVRANKEIGVLNGGVTGKSNSPQFHDQLLRLNNNKTNDWWFSDEALSGTNLLKRLPNRS